MVPRVGKLVFECTYLSERYGLETRLLDLTPYAGKVVTLRLRVPNRQEPEDNTWVYLDNFNLKFMETKTYQGFLPVVLH
jgi:hypothetical protein